MLSSFRRAAVAAAIAFLPGLAAAQETASIPSRVELHQISTLTLGDAQFLSGDEAGARPATVTGEFRVAQGNGRLPVAVLMHGSGGIGPNIEMWSRLLNAQGISTFAIDGFTGRGITSTSADQAQLGRLNFILDIYGALAILAKHPRVDPERIALVGFSRGGQGVLYASLERFHQRWNKSGAQFAAYIPFYPDCMTRYIDDTKPVPRPIRIVHGDADDYNPLPPCAAQAERMKAAGADITVTPYAGAHHGFDTPLNNMHSVAPTSQTVRSCRIEERSPGQLINAATGNVFAYTDACVERGPNVGGQAAAREAASQFVVTYLVTLFRR